SALVPDDVVVDLPLAEDEPLDAVVGRRGVVEHGPELAARKLLERRSGLLQPQEPLRRHDDERAGRRIERLPPQEMEVLGGRRAVRDPEVFLRRELEEALEAGTGVLGPVALVAVRQQQRQAGGLLPLRQAGSDELVDDDLRAVDEVAELRLPENE